MNLLSLCSQYWFHGANHKLSLVYFNPEKKASSTLREIAIFPLLLVCLDFVFQCMWTFWLVVVGEPSVFSRWLEGGRERSNLTWLAGTVCLLSLPAPSFGSWLKCVPRTILLHASLHYTKGGSTGMDSPPLYLYNLSKGLYCPSNKVG